LTRLSGKDAERAARVIEWMIADIEELRKVRQLPSQGMRTDITEARVTLLHVLSMATKGDLMGEDNQIELGESEARALYESLHTNVATGYERGDCHCDHCSNVVDTLVVYFGIEKPASGVYSPSTLIREKAIERGWEDPANA
jgi:hypothetical protein